MATPKLIVFDLDYTLWPFWIDTHHHPPYTRGPSGTVRDCEGFAVHCYPDVPAMLGNLQKQGYQMAIASRTSATQEARELVGMLGMMHYFQYQEIYPGKKTTHFNSFNSKSGVAYQDMLFFDDEERNIRDISNLGVTCILAKNGMSFGVLQEGFNAFRQRRSNPNVQ